jgi:hypothetical protein
LLTSEILSSATTHQQISPYQPVHFVNLIIIFR